MTDLVCWSDEKGQLFGAGLIVPGAQAVASWWALRNRASSLGHWPVLNGGAEGPRFSELPRLYAPPALLRQQARRSIEEAGRIAPDPRAFNRWHSGAFENLSAEEWQELCRQPDPPAAPADKEAEDSVRLEDRFSGHRDLRTHEPFPFVAIDLVPTAIPWEVFAYRPFGGFNGCPYPHEHLAMQRYWHGRHGAEIVSSGGDWYEMYVPRPPRSREDALLLAREMSGFGEETIFGYGARDAEQAVRTLRASRYWYFWWD